MYLDPAKELKKLSNMKVTLIPIMIGVHGTATKRLLKGQEDLKITGLVETTQTFKFTGRPSAYACVKNSRCK